MAITYGRKIRGWLKFNVDFLRDCLLSRNVKSFLMLDVPEVFANVLLYLIVHVRWRLKLFCFQMQFRLLKRRRFKHFWCLANRHLTLGEFTRCERCLSSKTRSILSLSILILLLFSDLFAEGMVQVDVGA